MYIQDEDADLNTLHQTSFCFLAMRYSQGLGWCKLSFPLLSSPYLLHTDLNLRIRAVMSSWMEVDRSWPTTSFGVVVVVVDDDDDGLEVEDVVVVNEVTEVLCKNHNTLGNCSELIQQIQYELTLLLWRIGGMVGSWMVVRKSKSMRKIAKAKTKITANTTLTSLAGVRILISLLENLAPWDGRSVILSTNFHVAFVTSCSNLIFVHCY